MSHEIHQQPAQEEVERTPEVQLFNVDAMLYEQIIVLHRGLMEVADRGRQESDTFDTMDIGDRMNEQLYPAVRNLATRDPERVKQIIEHGLASRVTADQELVGRTLESLVHYDWEFTRDTFVRFTVNKGHEFDGDAAYAAHCRLSILMRDTLTPEQTDDTLQRYYDANGGRDYSVPLGPAPTDFEYGS